MLAPTDRRVRCLITGIQLTPFVQLVLVGNHEPADRVERIVPIDEVCVVVVQPKGILRRDRLKAAPFVVREAIKLGQAGDVADLRQRPLLFALSERVVLCPFANPDLAVGVLDG